MDIREKIEELLEPLLENGRIFVVSIHISSGRITKKIVILIDSDAGIMIDECADISRKLGDKIEEIELFEEPYTLEVSSPGVDFPLSSQRSYHKNIGRTLKVLLQDGTETTGKLEAVTDTQITIVEEKKKKKKDEVVLPVVIELSTIKKAQVQVVF